ncbi:MAG: dihydrofolate reductase [Parvularculaceae bacterium]|nr:dihydrofolate reductase [Parvularculaceae bacterium]
MRIAIVVAAARNGVIGRDGGLAWKISDDLKRFREITLGKPVLMGRKTYESIGKPLPDRINIVISRSPAPIAGVKVVASIEEGLRLAAEAAVHLDAEEICVIGGAEIYAQTLALASRLYWTEVEADVAGDVRFPAFDPADWSKNATGRVERSSRNEHSAAFFVLDRL